MRILTVAAIFALISSAAPARAQHDHGGGQSMPPEAARSPEAAAKTIEVMGNINISQTKREETYG